MSLNRIMLALVLFCLAVGVGCNASTSSPKGAADGQPEAQAENEVAAALAKLEPAEQALARLQATCPVSDHLLGSMGPPIKVTHDGHDVFLCCEGCKEDFEKNAAAFVAKVKK